MLSSIYFFLLLLTIFTNVSSDQSSSFCLCALKDILEEYALFTTDRLPPRYHSLIGEDIGFFIGISSQWKPVNEATWIELSAMINAPSGMYTHISLDGIHPVNDGLQLDNRRSVYLAELIAAYRSLMSYVENYHKNVLQSRSGLCMMEQEQTMGGKFSRNQWQQFLLPG
jgi:hypothetical protein